MIGKFAEKYCNFFISYAKLIKFHINLAPFNLSMLTKIGIICIKNEIITVSMVTSVNVIRPKTF